MTSPNASPSRLNTRHVVLAALGLAFASTAAVAFAEVNKAAEPERAATARADVDTASMTGNDELAAGQQLWPAADVARTVLGRPAQPVTVDGQTEEWPSAPVHRTVRGKTAPL